MTAISVSFDAESGTLGGALRWHATKAGDSVFLMQDSTRRTYSDVEALTNSYARGFDSLGVGSGDPVVTMMSNSLELVYATLGVVKLGAFCVPVDTSFKLESLARAVSRSRAKMIVIDAALSGRLAPIWNELDVSHIAVHGGEMAEPLPGTAVHDLRAFEDFDTGSLPIEVDYRATAGVLWSSGTTGLPKGVVVPHFTWLYNVAQINKARDVRDGDVFHNVLPMYHAAAWVMNVYAALQSGNSVGIDKSFSVSNFWDRVRYYGASQIATLGAMQMFLWNAPARPDDADNPARRAYMTPLPADLVRPFCERFGLEDALQSSGQSEVMGWSFCDSRKPQWKPGSAGLPRDDFEVVLLDDSDQIVPVGEVGEICIRPRVPYSLFAGYYDDPEGTLKAFRNLWYHSGDLGRFDEDGELYFVDRKADFMRYKGRNISSMEVESYVRQHPAVHEVAAHGVRSQELASEDEVKVCIVLRPGAMATAEEIARFVNERAPYYIVPRYIEFYSDLPRTPTGKVQKFRLREQPISEATWDARAVGFVPVRD